MDIQLLGDTEAQILKWEQENLKVLNGYVEEGPFKKFFYIKHSYFSQKLLGFSKYWVFGLYEILRKNRDILRQKNKETSEQIYPNIYDIFNEVLWDIELIRMPLAKYEAAKIKNSTHWARIMTNIDTGSCSWEVYCKRSDDYRIISRKEISEKFLTKSMEALKILKIKPLP